MRITQGTMMRKYNSTLNNIMNDLNKANMKVINGRKFSTGAENPALSTKSSQLRLEYAKNANYLENAETIKSKFDTVADSVMMFSKSASDAFNATNGADSKSLEERLILAGQLESIQETMIKEANINVGDKFLFGGSSTKELPFALKNGEVTFRGIPVNQPAKIADPVGSTNFVDNPKYLKLKEMAGEELFVDLGFGLKVTDGKVDSGSAYNTATPGINYLGFGQDANGGSNNAIETIGEMAKMLKNPDVDEKAFQVLSQRLGVQKNNILVGVTTLGSQSKFVNYTASRLTSNEDLLNTKLVNTETVPKEQAITEFQAQDAIYRAALKMGTNILSVSFMDFMR